MRKSVTFLGHVVGENGIETDPDKINKIKNYPIPTNSDQLRSYLAFAGYYRKFVKDFAKLTRPLSDLLPTSHKKKRSQSAVPWKWETRHQEIVDQLRNILTSPPVLAYPDFTQSFELHTDTSSQ